MQSIHERLSAFQHTKAGPSPLLWDEFISEVFLLALAWLILCSLLLPPYHRGLHFTAGSTQKGTQPACHWESSRRQSTSPSLEGS